MFVTYIVGFTLYLMAMVVMKLEDYYYGVSFWVFIASLVLLLGATVYEKWKMSKIEKQEMVIKLLENEKEILRGTISDNSQS